MSLLALGLLLYACGVIVDLWGRWVRHGLTYTPYTAIGCWIVGPIFVSYALDQQRVDFWIVVSCMFVSGLSIGILCLKVYDKLRTKGWVFK